jgi:hypothetical protein
MKMRNGYKILVSENEGKIMFCRYKHREEHLIEKYPGGICI